MKEFLRRTHRVTDLAYGYFQIARQGFWFIDIPRTSSTSIRAELGKRFGKTHGKINTDKGYATQQIFEDHLTAREMRKRLGGFLWKKIFTFSIVRNPWDRTLSMYFFRLKRGTIPSEWTFRDYAIALTSSSPESDLFKYHASRYGLSDYVTGDDSEIIVDYIGRFENRETLKVIADRLKFKELGILSIQSASPKGKHYSEFYNEEIRDMVGRFYSKDIELFGYNFEVKS
ncbi:sulfotransferase family 2 domain-containing protein [Synechococcus sp. PCC 7336]|uniref:sulfotransferase family 2 domain-containing protein n=1 Tax=Synechococcus sp. PCC 7336 TaxID=195250 RepID=UPI00138ABEFC|nr:sulfotransferase family 2 domain-containing protein [Synechococcus sp. PCC 7336]